MCEIRDVIWIDFKEESDEYLKKFKDIPCLNEFKDNQDCIMVITGNKNL